MIMPFPSSKSIIVMRDIPGCDQMPWWQFAAIHKDAVVARYELPVDQDGDVDFTPKQWHIVFNDLNTKHPDCVFVYTSDTD